MKTDLRHFPVLLVVSLVVSGCAMPGRSRAKQESMPRVAQQPTAPASQMSLSDRPNIANPSVAPVGYTESVSLDATAAHLSDQSPVAACGCNACAPSSGGLFNGCGCGGGACNACRPQAPFGYAPTPGGCPPNAYGIDPQEFICDGGDHPPFATLRLDDEIAGLQPEDTVVHYTTQAGDIEFRESNRVCLYAPRFLSVRKITGAVAGGHAIGLAQVDNPVGAVRVDQPLPGLVIADVLEPGRAEVTRRIDAMRERNRGVPLESVQQLEMAGDVLAVLVGLTIDEILALQDQQRALLDKYLLCAITWELDEALEVVIEDLQAPVLVRDERVEGLTIYEFPDGRLQICKLADRADAQPGEIVNFAIRVENVGDAAVSNIVLTDNLTTRLEYVDGSQTASGGAIFESFANEGQSLRLQWKLTDELKVGESVTIRFQCRVR